MKTRKQAVRAAVLAAAAEGMVMAVAPANAMRKAGGDPNVARAQYRPALDRASWASIRQARAGATWLHVPMIDWDTLPLLLPGPVQQVSGDF